MLHSQEISAGLPQSSEASLLPQNREQLITTIMDSIMQWTHRQVQNLAITISDCGQEVHLHGDAPSYYIKQLAQEGAKRHGLRVHNAIVVATAA